MLKRSMNRVRELYRELRPLGHWFSPATMRFFKSRLPATAYLKGGDYYFISSEKFNYESPRLYTVRKMNGSDGEVGTIGPFNELTKTQAKRLLAETLNCKIKDL